MTDLQATGTKPAAMAKDDVPRFRFVVMSALWITGVFLYLDRVNISMAAPHIMEELGFSGVKMGFVLSIYYWGYIFGQLAGGFAADRLNIRRWCTVLYLGWCVITVTTGFCRTLAQFSVVRLIFGAAEGAVINPITKLQNHWVFPRERGMVNGIQVCAGYMGLVLGMPLVGWLINVVGWRQMFFLTGLLTLLGVLVFWLLVYDHPRDHPRISQREKNMLEEALEADRVTFDPSRGHQQGVSFNEGLRILVRNWAYWCICGAFLFVAGIYFTNFSWLPGYLVMERGFSDIQSGNSLVLPYLSAGIGALTAGYIGDKLGNRSAIIILAAACTIPAIAGLLMMDDPAIVIATLCVMLFFNAAAVSLFVVLLFDLLPAEVIGVALATLVGIFGGIGGVAGPLVMGYAYDQTGSFLWGFVTMAGGMLIAIAFMIAVFVYERRIKMEKRRKESVIQAYA